MRVVSLVLACALFAGVVSAQGDGFPAVLQPSRGAEEIAKANGASSFVLLPRGTKDYGYADSDDPIGIRGGGSYYSFSTGSHSYNKTPQIGFEKGMFQVGFYGLNTGLITDLGNGSLDLIDAELPAFKALSAFHSPDTYSAISELKGQTAITIGGIEYRRRVTANIGHSYLLRAICYTEKVDVIVAFQVIQKRPDGAVEIAWKKMAEMPRPIYHTLDDTELSKRVLAVLRESRYRTVRADVRNDEVILTGEINADDLTSLLFRIADIRPLKIVNRIIRIRPEQ